MELGTPRLPKGKKKQLARMSTVSFDKPRVPRKSTGDCVMDHFKETFREKDGSICSDSINIGYSNTDNSNTSYSEKEDGFTFDHVGDDDDEGVGAMVRISNPMFE